MCIDRQNHIKDEDYDQVEDQSSLHKYRTEIPNCLLYAKLSPTEFLIYCLVKKIAGDTGKCFMSHKNISLIAGISEKTVRTSLDNLCLKNEFLKTHLIKKTCRKKESGSLDTCLYTIVDLWPLNMKLASQDNFGTVKFTEGIRQNLPKGTVKFTDKEEPIKKNPIKKEEDEEKKSSSSAIKINKDKRSFEGITDDMLLIWKDTFPSLEINSQLKQCFAKAYNLRHRDDWLGYILNWLQTSEKQVQQNPTKSDKISECTNINKRKLTEFVLECKNTSWKLTLLEDRLEFVKIGTKRYRAILFDALDFSDRFNELTKLIGK